MATRTKLILLGIVLLIITIGVGIVGYRDSVHDYTTVHFKYDDSAWHIHPNTRLVGHTVYPLKRDTIYLNKVIKFLNDVQLDSLLRVAHDSDIYVKQVSFVDTNCDPKIYWPGKFNIIGRADNGHDELMGDVGKILNK